MTTDRSPVHTGGCQCGAIRYALYAEPIEASICHCWMCQKAMGNVFAPLAKIPLAEFAWTRGEPSVFRSSPVTERGFCPACGTPLSFAYTDAGADWVEVTMGSLDEPGRVNPTGHFGIESTVPWLHLADGLPGVRTEENTLPERLARIVNYQHPDHDTPILITTPRPAGNRIGDSLRGISGLDIARPHRRLSSALAAGG